MKIEVREDVYKKKRSGHGQFLKIWAFLLYYKYSLTIEGDVSDSVIGAFALDYFFRKEGSFEVYLQRESISKIIEINRTAHGLKLY